VEHKQRQYLQAMGVDTWMLRVDAQPPSAPSDVVPVPAVSLNTTTECDVQVTHGPVPQKQDEPSVHESVHEPVETAADTNGVIASYGWDQLQAAVRHCVACDLHVTRKNTVFGVGDSQADWMIVGEAPGADEDRQGEPFVGRAGQLLNKMLQAIGLNRQQVFIANTLKCRPPDNRDPRAEEVMKCEAYLKRQVELVKPKIILVVGRIAAHNLLKTNSSLAQLRGKCFYYKQDNNCSDAHDANADGDAGVVNTDLSSVAGPSNPDSGPKTALVVTYHPAYLLRSPREKRKAWQDLLFAQAVTRGEIS